MIHKFKKYPYMISKNHKTQYGAKQKCSLSQCGFTAASFLYDSCPGKCGAGKLFRASYEGCNHVVVVNDSLQGRELRSTAIVPLINNVSFCINA